MAVEKVRILKRSGSSWETVLNCAAQFNPQKLQLSKSASWKTQQSFKSNVGNTTFTGGNPISLSVQMFLTPPQPGPMYGSTRARSWT